MRRIAVVIALIALALADVGGTSGVGDGPAITLTLGTEIVQEGPRGSFTNVPVHVTLPEPASQRMDFVLLAQAGTATVQDFHPGTNEGRIARNRLSTTVNVRVRGDSIVEDHETFTVVFASTPGGYSYEPLQVTITDDDGPAQIRAVSAIAEEGPSATGRARVKLALTSPVERDVHVQWTTIDGTATSHDDYRPRAGTTMIRAGSTTVSHWIPLRDDDDIELGESFAVQIASAEAVPGPGHVLLVPSTPEDLRAEVTVFDDDALDEGGRTLFVLDPIEEVDIARVLEVVGALDAYGGVERIVIDCEGLTAENWHLYRALILPLRARGLQVDALSGGPAWGANGDVVAASAFVDAVAHYNDTSTAEYRFDGLHLDVRPWTLEGATEGSVVDALTAVMAVVNTSVPTLTVTANVDADASHLFAPAGVGTVAMALQSGSLLGTLHGLGVDRVSILTESDDPATIIAEAGDEISEASLLGLDSFVTSFMTFDDDPSDTFADDTIDHYRLAMLHVDAAFHTFPGYDGGGGIIDLRSLALKLADEGLITSAGGSTGAALFVHDAIAGLDVPTLIGFAQARGITDLIVDGSTIGLPSDDPKYAGLLSAAHASNMDVIALGGGGDGDWLVTTGDDDFVAAVLAYNGGPGDDFDGVFVDIDPGWTTLTGPALTSAAASFQTTIQAIATPVHASSMRLEVAIPDIDDGDHVSTPDFVGLVAGSADAITVMARADAPASIFDALDHEAVESVGRVDGFRAGVHLSPRPNPSETLWDEGPTIIGATIDGIDEHYLTLDTYKGVAVHDYAAAYEKAVGVPPPTGGTPNTPPFLQVTSFSFANQVHSGPVPMSPAPPPPGCSSFSGGEMIEWCFVQSGPASPVTFTVGATDAEDGPIPLVLCTLASPVTPPEDGVAQGQCTATDSGGMVGRFDYLVVNLPGPPNTPPVLNVSAFTVPSQAYAGPVSAAPGCTPTHALISIEHCLVQSGPPQPITYTVTASDAEDPTPPMVFCGPPSPVTPAEDAGIVVMCSAVDSGGLMGSLDILVSNI